MGMDESKRQVDLMATFPEVGCPVCQLVKRDVHQYLDSLLYEYVNKLDIRIAVRASRGFCSAHAWHMHEIRGRVVNISVLHHTALHEIGKIVKRHPPGRLGLLARRRFVDSFLNDLDPEGPCLACETMLEAESSYIHIIADSLKNEPGFLGQYREWRGICLPHVRQLLKILDPSQYKPFMEVQAELWLKLQDELELFKQKNEVTYHGEPVGEEGDSWERASYYLTGLPELFGPRR